MAWDTQGPPVGCRLAELPGAHADRARLATSCSSSKTPTTTATPTSARTFLDDLNCPTGFQFYKDGVLVMQVAGSAGSCATPMATARPTGKSACSWARLRPIRITTTNSMCHEPGGAIYLSDGVFHRTQVETRGRPGAQYRRRHLPLRAAHRQVRALRRRTASRIRTAASSITGATTSSPTPPATQLLRRRRSAGISTTRTSTRR